MRFNPLYYFILFFTVVLNGHSQNKAQRPKLVVGIVIDQMRNDYIYRYWDRFGKGGFKRLVNKGYYFRNAHYNYIPTFTGPGHSSIYTGATPRSHGIIANDWHNKGKRNSSYCVGDSLVKSVGAEGKSGQMSPRNQLSSTIGDELKMSSNGRAKVFGIGLKDRSAILPAGHAANGAYWFDDASAGFISSTWYMNELPGWVKEFNQLKLPAAYLQKGWSPLYDISTYTASIPDNNPYEAVPSKKETPEFPYTYHAFIEKNNLGIVKATPWGNTLTKELAMACIKNEGLGADNETDLLCLSFSSPDIVAHSYGPRSVETEDLYLRLDKEIEELLLYLDHSIGKDNYLVFVTADHGGADVPNHLRDHKIPAGYGADAKIKKALQGYSYKTYADSGLIENVSNEQVFLNEEKLQKLSLEKNTVEKKLCEILLQLPGVAEAYPSEVMRNGSFSGNDYRAFLQNGYHHKLSGNIVFMYNPAWMDYMEKGTTHGAGYNYDTHVPILFYGRGIKKGSSLAYVSITQIAPSICELLRINQPNACIAVPLGSAIKK